MKRLIVLLMMAAATCAHAADNAPRNVGIAQAAGGDASDMMVRGAGRPMARSQAARAADSYNVRDFGARGDGTTDDRAAINAALTAASAAGGGTVYFPAGTYRVAASAGHVAPLSHVTMAGAGRQRSTILIDDSAGGGDGISNCAGNTCTPIEDFHIRDLTVSGMRATIVSQGVQIVRIGAATDISFENAGFVQARFMGLVVVGSNRVTVRDCYVYHTNADGIAAWDDSALLVTGNQIEGASDDAISAHSDDNVVAPVRSGLVISNNVITESQGISVGGAKGVIISGNVLRRIMTYGINIWAEGGHVQGDTSLFGVRIDHNIIEDVFERSEPHPRNQSKDYILVTSGPRIAGGGASAPGTPAPGTGRVTPLYGADGVGNFYANGISAGSSVAGTGGYWVDITDNQLIRTLPSVAAYSDWGYNKSLFVGDNGDPATGLYNGPISETALSPTSGIRIAGSLRNARIAGNVIQTGGTYGINFNQAYAWRSGDLDGLLIERNKIVDFVSAGVWFNVGATTQRVMVRANEFDGDPRFASANRGAGGTWVNGSGRLGVPMGVYNHGAGAAFIGDTFRNVVTVMTACVPQDCVRQGNLIYAQPSATGFSRTNRGVGTIPADGPEYGFIPEDSDPTSATYGQQLSPQVSSATAPPAAGLYVAGHMVWNSAPAASGGISVIGWLRLTTGGGNVPGTDWQPLYTLGRRGSEDDIQQAAPVRLSAVTVATLPACAANHTGDAMYVTDAASPGYNAALRGGGTTKVLAICDGTRWTAH